MGSSTSYDTAKSGKGWNGNSALSEAPGVSGMTKKMANPKDSTPDRPAIPAARGNMQSPSVRVTTKSTAKAAMPAVDKSGGIPTRMGKGM